MHRGYIKDWRKELESDIWQMPPLYGRVWQWIKLSANHKDRAIPQPDGTDFIVKEGQRLTSLRGIARGVAWYEGRKQITPSAETIGRVIKWLEAKNMIAVDRGECDREYTLITVTNWAFYQGPDSNGVTPTGTPTEQGQVHPQVLNKNEERMKRNKYIIPSDFSITDEMREWAIKTVGPVDWLDEVTAEFVEYWQERGEKRPGWIRTWKNRIKDVAEYRKQKGMDCIVSGNELGDPNGRGAK